MPMSNGPYGAFKTNDSVVKPSPSVLQPCSEFPLSFSYSDSTPGQYGRTPETSSTGLRLTRYPFPENPGCYNTMPGGCSIEPSRYLPFSFTAGLILISGSITT